MSELLRITFEQLRIALLQLDKEEESSDAALYLQHRKILNERIRRFDFVVGVNHFNRHALIPLIHEQKAGPAGEE